MLCALQAITKCVHAFTACVHRQTSRATLLSPSAHPVNRIRTHLAAPAGEVGQQHRDDPRAREALRQGRQLRHGRIARLAALALRRLGGQRRAMMLARTGPGNCMRFMMGVSTRQIEEVFVVRDKLWHRSQITEAPASVNNGQYRTAMSVFVRVSNFYAPPVTLSAPTVL